MSEGGVWVFLKTPSPHLHSLCPYNMLCCAVLSTQQLDGTDDACRASCRHGVGHACRWVVTGREGGTAVKGRGRLPAARAAPRTRTGFHA